VRSQQVRFWITDGAIAAVFAALGQLGLRFHDGSGEIGHASLAAGSVLIAFVAPPLVFRRAAPFRALWLVALILGSLRLIADVTVPLWGGFGALVFALYSCSRHAARPLDRYALAAPGVTLLMLTLEIRGFASASEYSFSVPILLLAWPGLSARSCADGRDAARCCASTSTTSSRVPPPPWPTKGPASPASCMTWSRTASA
jgi:hypothetical protein